MMCGSTGQDRYDHGCLLMIMFAALLLNNDGAVFSGIVSGTFEQHFTTLNAPGIGSAVLQLKIGYQLLNSGVNVSICSRKVEILWYVSANA